MGISNFCQLSQYTRSSLILFRIPEVVFAIVTGGVAIALAYSGRVIPSNRMTIPDISFVGSTGSSSVQNPTYSYPIKLDGHNCFPSDIYSCIRAKQAGDPMTAGCCATLYDVNIDPTQTVANPFLIFLGIIIPFIVFIIRAALWRLYISRQWSLPSEAHIATPCSLYYSVRGALFSIISVPPATLDILIHLHRNSTRNVSTAWTSSSEYRKQKFRDISIYQQRDRIACAHDVDANDESRYEIIDSNGNTIKTRAARNEDVRDVRDIEVCDRERCRRDDDPSPPQSSDVLNESFLGNNSLGISTITPTASTPLQQMFWLLLIYEPSVSLAIASAFQGIICLGLKRYVGAPRPNYYALSAWASIYPDPADRFKDLQSARFSFPSGHAATAAAGLGILILVLLKDVKKLRRKCKQMISNPNDINNLNLNLNSNFASKGDQEDLKRNANTTDAVYLMILFSLLIMLSVCLIFWIGGSRIKDYYHFAPDVIGKSILLFFSFCPHLYFFSTSSQSHHHICCSSINSLFCTCLLILLLFLCLCLNLISSLDFEFSSFHFVDFQLDG